MFESYEMVPKVFPACQYNGNRSVLTQHSSIAALPGSEKLVVQSPEGEVFAEPFDWIVKMDNDFYVFKPEEFAATFKKKGAFSIGCLFCDKQFPSIGKVRLHSAECEAHPLHPKYVKPVEPVVG